MAPCIAAVATRFGPVAAKLVPVTAYFAAVLPDVTSVVAHLLSIAPDLTAVVTDFALVVSRIPVLCKRSSWQRCGEQCCEEDHLSHSHSPVAVT
jgi:hypothetical protein